MQRALRKIGKLHSLAVQRSLHEQQHALGINACLLQQSDLQQAAAAVYASSSSSPGQWPWVGSVRSMACRTHKLSLKKANNKASWLAVTPFLEQQRKGQGDKLQQLRDAPVIPTAIPPLPVLEQPTLYRRIGRMTGPYSVAAQPCFAVMESGGSQWKVTADDVIYHNKIPGVQINDVVEFSKVLLLGTREETTIGRPFVPGASVVAAVEETFKDAKVHVFKKKKRKRYSKLMGHRSHITALRILEVRQPAEAAAKLEGGAAGAAIANVAAIGSSSSVAFMPRSQRQGSARSTSPATQAAALADGVEEASAAADPVPAGSQPTAQQLQQQQHVGQGRPLGPPAVVNAVGLPPPRRTHSSASQSS